MKVKKQVTKLGLGKKDFEVRFQEGVKWLDKKNLKQAESVYLDLDTDYPDQPNVIANLGFIALKLQDYVRAIALFQRLEALEPNNVDAKNKVAVAAMHLGDYDQAELKLRQALKLSPENFLSTLNYCCALGYLGRDSEGLGYAMKAIKIEPTNASGYIQLGSHLQMVNRHREAKEAFLTARALEPDSVLAISNLGVICSYLGDLEEADSYYAQAMDRATAFDRERVQQAKFFRGITQLRMGRLKEGWANYEAGFSPILAQGRTPRRNFLQPRWDGEELAASERLLVWREQGLGDELIFLTAIPQIHGLAKNLVVETDSRLVTALQRSHEGIRFRAEQFGKPPEMLPLNDDFSTQIPMGSAFGLMRPNLQSFEGGPPLIIPEKERTERLARRVNRQDGRFKVGICWRSGMLSPTRNRHYTNIDQWGPVFNLSEDVDFFSLQYGDCAAEIDRANSEFGVFINRWPDLDYKNDLESLFSLSSLMDCVVTVGTAVSTIAAATGTKVLLMNIPGWPCFGTGHFPSFPSIEVFPEPFDGDVANQLVFVSRRLEQLWDEKKAGGSPAF